MFTTSAISSIGIVFLSLSSLVFSAAPPLSQQCRQKGFTRAPLILIGLDGFHPDLLKKPVSNHLKIIRSKGVGSLYMRPVYPTKTFPNLYSIVTGLYPESHGIVENHFKDPTSGTEFFHTKNETYDKIKWGGEPIWVTAKKQGINYAVKHWPGDHVTFDGIGPNEFTTKGRTNYRNNINEIMSYMRMPESQRPGFITLYYNQPDHNLHRYGPNAPEVDNAIRDVSASLSNLFEQLYKAQIDKCVNIIIVSDHGMTSTPCNKLTFLNQIADLGHVSFLSGPSVMIEQFKSQNNPQQIFSKIRCQGKQNPIYDVYLKRDFPIRHHYGNNDRIGDVLIKMAEGYNMFRYSGRKPDCEKYKGGHGYDDGLRSMQSIFMAYGAHFKNGQTVLPFQNIELYNLMAALLGIEPAPNNGTFGLLADALTFEHRPYEIKSYLQPVKYYDMNSQTKDLNKNTYPDDGYMSGDDNMPVSKRMVKKVVKKEAQIEGGDGLDDYYNLGDDVSMIDPEGGKSTQASTTIKSRFTPPPGNSDSDLTVLYDTGDEKKPYEPGTGNNKFVSGAPKISSGELGKCCSSQGINEAPKMSTSSPSSTLQNLLTSLAPFEVPKSIFVPTAILPNDHYISGYDEKNNFPLWVSYVGKSTSQDQIKSTCINMDSRLNSNQMDYCQFQTNLKAKDGLTILPLKLFNSGNNGNLLTNVVYVYKDFYDNIWSGTMKKFEDLAVKRSANIIIGPVFDHNGDGLMDSFNTIPRYGGDNNIAIPSHIFVMITYCKNNPRNQCEAKDMTLNSFVIPHRKEPENCENLDDYFRKYYVRVKDIELLTGLKFFTKYPEQDRIKLITHFPLNLSK